MLCWRRENGGVTIFSNITNEQNILQKYRTFFSQCRYNYDYGNIATKFLKKGFSIYPFTFGIIVSKLSIINVLLEQSNNSILIESCLDFGFGFSGGKFNT